MTPCSKIIDFFYNKVEKDKDFFHYCEMSDEEITKIINVRAFNYLDEAVKRILMETTPSIEFNIVTIDDEHFFEDDLTQREILLLVSIMYEIYLSRDIAYLKCLNVNYTSTDLRVFDPSNARKTFMEMYTFISNENKGLLDIYKNSDRNTGAFKVLDFASYNSEE